METGEKKITVQDLLHEHMGYLADRASQAEGGSKEEKAIIGAMEDIQCLMTRLDVPDGDQYLDRLKESRIFLRLSYDSKVLVLEHTRAMNYLIERIGWFATALEDNNQKHLKKIARSIGWRLFRLFVRLPWGR